MTEYTFDKTKGQSAIEYLMTYGWMLLVVAIVGGAIFATVQGQCTQSTSGFSGGDVLIDNFGTDSNDQLQITVRNGGASELNISQIDFGGSNDLTFEDSDGTVSAGTTIGVGNSKTLTVTGGTFTSSDGCNDYDLEFTYAMGELTDQVTSGTLTDSIDFESP